MNTEDEISQRWQEIHDALRAATDESDVLRLVDASEALVAGAETIPPRLAAGVVGHLSGATAWVESPERAFEYADRAAAVVDRCSEPAAAGLVGWVVRAYANATELATDVESTRRAARAASTFAGRLDAPHAGVDEELLRALRNLSVDEPEAEPRGRVADAMREIAGRYAEPVEAIDAYLAAAVANYGGRLDEGSLEHLGVLREVENLQVRWPTSTDIADSLAMALWNAWRSDVLEGDPGVIAGKLGEIGEALPTTPVTFDWVRVRMLVEAQPTATSWAEHREIAERVGAIARDRQPPDRQIDEAWAQAAWGPGPAKREAAEWQATVDLCGEIAERHAPSDDPDDPIEQLRKRCAAERDRLAGCRDSPAD